VSFARHAQVQERMTKQVVDWLAEHLQPKGVGVVLRAERRCMTLRGAQLAGTTTVTSALQGLTLGTTLDPSTEEFRPHVTILRWMASRGTYRAE
jgi:GTP cyclohydrolase I